MQWEYKTLKHKTKGIFGGKFEENELDRLLNGLGTEGWELVNAFGTNEGYGSTREVVLIMKRQRKG